MRVKIHREGLNILVVLLFILLVINIPAWLFMRPVAIPVTFTVISAVVYLLVLNFFRSPRRSFKGNRDNVVVASADGKVVALEETYEDEFLHCRCIQLSVFMSVLNVHATGLGRWQGTLREAPFRTIHVGLPAQVEHRE